jgi:hypothetical protein
MMDRLFEAIKTLANKAQICVIVYEHGDDSLLCTQLEDVFFEAQELVDRHCVKEDNEIG